MSWAAAAEAEGLLPGCFEMPESMDDVLDAKTAAALMGRGTNSATISGVPPFGWDPALGELRDADVAEVLAAANDRERLSPEYRQRLQEAEDEARDALAAAVALRPPAAEDHLEVCRALLEFTRTTMDPDAADIAALVIREVAEGGEPDMEAVEAIADPSKPAHDYAGLSGADSQFVDDLLREHVLGEEGAGPEYDERAGRRDDIIDFLPFLEDEWEPVASMFYAYRDEADRQLTTGTSCS
ncbi:MAG: hypothetical protein J3K34DRAFT_414899 [Monoraphidium minutum]|nr:MAG: hypothetical protein J3K34DRAFT_414899 [Monoraphidium minutum]